MAKQRLQAWMRDKLGHYAHETVIPAKSRAALDAAYAKAAPLVRAMVEKKYLPKDMVICKKYEVTAPDACITMQFPDNSVQQFSFLTQEEAPIVVCRSGCHRRMFIADAPTAKAVDAWIDASEAFETERKTRINAYKALVQGSAYLDDIIEIWPEAREAVPLNALPIALGPEQLEIINKDRRERSKAAA